MNKSILPNTVTLADGTGVTFSHYDVLDYLKTEEDVTAYLEAAQEDGWPPLVEQAQASAAEARARIRERAGRIDGVPGETGNPQP